MKAHEKDIFKTLENRGKTATDKVFIRKLADWVMANEGAVNVVMRLKILADGL